MGGLRMAAVLALALVAPVLAGVDVTTRGDHVDVVAAGAPISDVLDSLARKTRMKVVYEGPAPRNPVTVELRGRTPAQAVLGVLEGLGLSYALVLDASGNNVETLMITGPASARSAAGSPRPERAARTRQAPHANPDNPEVESDEPPPEPVDAFVPEAVEVAAPPSPGPSPSPGASPGPSPSPPTSR
jgi:hypothetical protein